MSMPPVQPGASPTPAQGGAADPSMEDILASIRRILSEDESEQPAAAQPGAAAAPASDVLALDSSMLVDEPPAPAPPPRIEPSAPSPPPPRVIEVLPPPPPSPPPPVMESRVADDSLLGPEAAAAAASSMGSLLRTLVSERQQVAVYRGGPTIEDIVREELRPLLKQWLDSNLPPMVERLVRAEIERVVGRAVP